ncbi:MAG: hypothetical protein BWX72_01121 [Firmicutes bacterium ADurb.Bin080]|jgi:hypothetical protein|nr:hypothetical protein [Clostridiales bacterium]OQC14971.1 MAG: hypothetical protein BWX72_01121 [Firmicutes bacterium ADurb.Bin080]
MRSYKLAMEEYKNLLKKGDIQFAYRGIISFFSRLRIFLKKKYPTYVVSSVYPGYMDMTYIAFTPMEIHKKNLKIAIVYLHEKNILELWLSASNRKIQAEYVELFNKEKVQYKISRVGPGVDSIIEKTIVQSPDLDNSKELISEIEKQCLDFCGEIESFVSKSIV